MRMKWAQGRATGYRNEYLVSERNPQCFPLMARRKGETAYHQIWTGKTYDEAKDFAQQFDDATRPGTGPCGPALVAAVSEIGQLRAALAAAQEALKADDRLLLK